MGSAVSSLMGGGGGGLLGAVGGIVGGMFGGPIGAAIGQAVGNMLQEAVGDAVKDGTQQLQQEHGMPSFVADLVKQAVNQTLDGLRDNSVPAETQQAAQDHFGTDMRGVKDAVQKDFVNEVLAARGQQGSEDNGGGGWLQAIAKAMGKTLGDKAGKMVELSQKMSANSSSGNDKAKAQEFNNDMTQFQATGQEYSMLNSVFSTAIKALGEALSAMARKQ